MLSKDWTQESLVKSASMNFNTFRCYSKTGSKIHYPILWRILNISCHRFFLADPCLPTASQKTPETLEQSLAFPVCVLCTMSRQAQVTTVRRKRLLFADHQRYRVSISRLPAPKLGWLHGSGTSQGQEVDGFSSLRRSGFWKASKFFKMYEELYSRSYEMLVQKLGNLNH